MISVKVNGKQQKLDVPSDMRLLWALRDILGLTGTKFGCGVSACGACTVHLDGKPVRSCVIPVAIANGKTVTTIEGLSENGEHPLQKAWVRHQTPQCGYCQTGMIMSAAALLKNNPDPSDEDINEAITNICRCGTYTRIRAAIHDAAKSLVS